MPTSTVIDVPKLSSQIGDAPLYETLRDIVKRTSAYVNSLFDSLDTRTTTLESIVTVLPPPGSIVMWGTATAPTGWLLCNGASVSTQTYASLFAVIGYTFGGAGTSFSVPDFRQRFPLGVAAAGTGSVLAGTGGAINHVHTVDPPSTNTGATSTTVTVQSGLDTAVPTYDHVHAVDIAQFNSGANDPPFLAVNFIIKT